MARKDRVPDPPKRPQGPQRRSTPTDPAKAARQRRVLAMIAASGLVALAVVLGFVFTGGGGDERGTLEAAGCTLEIEPGLAGEHSVEIGATSPKWNTDPPTSGPHNALPAVWGFYEDPVALAQSLHNLEHGGIVIQYGDGVPAAEIEAIRAFYDKDPNGLVVARLPKLGKRITLGAWTTENSSPAQLGTDNGKGYLATCTSFDKGAFSSFVQEHRYKGPERFPKETLIPGS